MLFRRTLVPVIWISSMVAAAPAQTARPTDSGTQDVPNGPELEASKTAREARLPAEKEPPRDAPADTPNKSSPGAANSTVNVDAETTGSAPTGATTHTQTRNGVTNTTHTPRAQQTQGVATPGVHLRAKTTTNVPARTATPAPFETPRSLRKDPDGVRRDPAGRRGISPFWDAIRRGDEAALVHDLARAEVAYQAAIVIESENPIAYLRLGQISVRGSKLDQAEVAYQDALRFSSRDSTLRATALFVLADLRERQGQRDEAIAAWQAYEEYLKKDPNAKGYPDTPIERASRLRKYSALAAESKAVRERINLRIKEADEASRRKTANNPNANR